MRVPRQGQARRVNSLSTSSCKSFMIQLVWLYSVHGSVLILHCGFYVHHHHYYPRDAIRRVGLCDSYVSVCLSVHLLQPVLYLHHLMAPSFQLLASYDSSKNLQGITPSDGDFWDCGGFEQAIMAIFRPISHRISETMQDTTKITIEH